ncbi:pentapeptide repeat-containing protein [Paractinoplanes maris]|uniref:pentapeptide repeat-containing protein n=1 Tax=Paractinoplanes maris TaxID=1734446 RepID=UPI0020225335|nr:pentapeptide repeat-containing protein [Actinoplanes maris]
MGLGATALVVSLIGATATFVVGLLNYRRQGQTIALQQEYQVRQVELLYSAQVADRFNRAVAHLGSDNLHLRLGGIYALEWIARDSPEHRQYVAATLAAFIRTSLPTDKIGVGGAVPILRLHKADAQAALTVVCRSPVADAGPVDLSRTDLRRAYLRDALLEGADLYASRLEGSDLRGARLVGSSLKEANVGRVDSGNPAFRKGTDLRGADLTGAEFGRLYNADQAVTDATTRGWP